MGSIPSEFRTTIFCAHVYNLIGFPGNTHDLHAVERETKLRKGRCWREKIQERRFRGEDQEDKRPRRGGRAGKGKEGRRVERRTKG